MNETINQDIRQHETGLKHGEWVYPISRTESVDLQALSQTLYKFFELFNGEYFNGRLPLPLITFKTERQNSLGHFRPGRNDIGARFETNINTKHLGRPLMQILKTLLHEMDHLAQDAYPDIHGGHSTSNYHNKRFRDMAAAQGIPCSVWGVTLELRNPFKAFCISHGVETIDYSAAAADKEPCPRKKKLRKWICQCENNYGVWVAAGKTLHAHCNDCRADFELAVEREQFGLNC